MSIPGIDFSKRDAGQRACAQLVRAATSAPLRKTAAGCALARLHDLKNTSGYVMIAALHSLEDVCATVSALVKVYSVSLREAAAPKGPSAAAGEEQADSKDTKDSCCNETSTIDTTEYGQPRPGSGRVSRGTGGSCGRADGGSGGDSEGPFPEDWVPLLVDSSALVAGCISTGISAKDILALPPITALCTTDPEHRLRQIRSCAVAMVAALLLSDALPALSRLLSAEAHRGPARALLNPCQLAMCLQPLNELLKAAAESPTAPLPVDPPSPHQPGPPALIPPTATTTTTPALSAVPPTPTPTPGTSAPPAMGPSTATPAAPRPPHSTEAGPRPPDAASSAQAQTSCSMPCRTAGESGGSAPRPPVAAGKFGGSAAVPPPQGSKPTARVSTQTPHRPQRLGAAALCAVAESGVVEAACRAAMPLVVQQGGGGRQQRKRDCLLGGDREQLLGQLLELPRLVLTAVQGNTADALPTERLRSMLTGPCVQYALAASSVSQLHAVDGGTTYGLPYDSLMPLVREEEHAELPCRWLKAGIAWWASTCRVGGLPQLQLLSPHGLVELCLRNAEVAADCWRRCSGLPAAAEAAATVAGGSAGHSGSGGQGASSSSGKAARRGRQHAQGKALSGAHGVSPESTGCQAGMSCFGGAARTTERGGCISPAADPPRATLDPSQCPDLAMRAMTCSLALMESSCGVGARSVAWLRDGGPLARRWWRAAVAAVHCALDEMAVGLRPAASSAHKVLDLSPTTSGPGPESALPAAPPAALSAALDAGYLPCLERTLRTCFRACATPAEAVRVCGGLLHHDTDVSWHLLLAFGNEREAAAFLATAAKVARRTCEERARPGGNRAACAAVMGWLNCTLSTFMFKAADHIARRIAVERGFRNKDGSILEKGGGSGGGGGGSSTDGGGDGGGIDGGGVDGGGPGGGRGCSAGCNGGGGAGSSDGAVGSRSSCEHSDTGMGGGDAASGGGHCFCGHGRGGGGGGNTGGGGSSLAAGGAGSSSGGSSGGGADSDGCGATLVLGNAHPAAVPAAAQNADSTDPAACSLSPPEQQMLRLLSFALPLWLPLWLDLAAAMLTDGRLTRSWREEVRWAFDMLDLVQTLCEVAFDKNLRAAESWRSIVGRSGNEVVDMLDACSEMLEREEKAARGIRGAQARHECGVTAERLHKKMDEVEEGLFMLNMDLPSAMIKWGEVEGGWEQGSGWEGLWPLAGLGLLSPPCDARQLLPCCSNPRCAELAGDSEAGVVLRRCGGACGGAAAYCCAACQRAHWAAGHREECAGKKGSGESGVESGGS